MAISISSVSVTTPDGSSNPGRLRRQGAADRERGQPLWLHQAVRRSAGSERGLRRQGAGGAGFPLQRLWRPEPGTLDEIKNFCSTTYGADFELFDKVHAKGSTTEPYTTLNQMDPAGDVEWNFEKFLVGKDGTVIARFKSGVTPEDLKSAIEAALAA